MKSQTTEQTTKDIKKYNITVANLDGSVDIKAVKSGWEAYSLVFYIKSTRVAEQYIDNFGTSCYAT